jgi:exopolysaccharide biosynthesis polyprenyl glycosylphosphotransferase
MLKLYQGPLSFLQKGMDGISLITAWFLSYYLRFYFIPGGQEGLLEYFLYLSWAPPLIFFVFAFQQGIYRSYRYSTLLQELKNVLAAYIYSFLGLSFIFYFFLGFRLSRLSLIFYFFISIILLITLRLTVRYVLRILRMNHKNLRHVVLIGHGTQMNKFVASALSRNNDIGLKIRGWIDDNGQASHTDQQITPLDINPTQKNQILQLKENLKIDGLIIGLSHDQLHKLPLILNNCYNDTLSIQILPDLGFDFLGHTYAQFQDQTIITLNPPKLSFVDLSLKRFTDIILSFLGLVILTPLMITLILLVKLTSKGPCFYGQQRMGLDGKIFTMWKFRSMRTDAENTTGAIWCVENDPRRTPIGKFLRTSSLDELPQLWNVLKGDMSLVGPRPERPIFVEKFRDEIPAYMLRHKVKTGITGLAQINGLRGNTSLQKRIEMDLIYIKNWSLLLDIKILILTFWKGIFNKNAY